MLRGRSWNDVYEGSSSELQISQLIAHLLSEVFQSTKRVIRHLKTHLQIPHCKPTENPICSLSIHSIFCILNNCQSFIKHLVSGGVILFCLGFELQGGVYSICFLWGGA